eukprot:CAMPEP_0195258720 /NCGR_PEP_ID=MMETSP0706-20130129/7555_1 /TAXON_ID=33640 /ORGANISM="Asterionellopsis glacialis, Strain CCMP134" /LENGTH=69 /DNA_ID=CAMNT_0040312119 /DNA_START=58 /DNA_END=267 /DNA_ORIENTATION=-
MPWQAAPSFIIIMGAFNVTAGLMWGIQRLSYGKDRAILRDEWSYSLECRDDRVEEYRTMMKKAAAEIKK